MMEHNNLEYNEVILHHNILRLPPLSVPLSAPLADPNGDDKDKRDNKQDKKSESPKPQKKPHSTSGENHTIYIDYDYPMLMFDYHCRGNPERYFDVQNDIYPDAILKRSPSLKLYGQELEAAVWYFQSNRIRELVSAGEKEVLAFEKEYDCNSFLEFLHKEFIAEKYEDAKLSIDKFQQKYKNEYSKLSVAYEKWKYIFNKYWQKKTGKSYRSIYTWDLQTLEVTNGNIFHVICGAEMPNGIAYEFNRQLWDDTFLVLLQSFSPENLPRLLNSNVAGGYNMPIYVALLCNKPLYAFALLNLGSQYNPDCLSKEKNIQTSWPWLIDLNKLSGLSSSSSGDMTCKKDSFKPDGKECAKGNRFLFQIFCTQDCPISLETLLNPVMLEDGTVYDHDFLRRWFEMGNNRNCSPLTNLPLKCHPRTCYNLKNNTFIYF